MVYPTTPRSADLTRSEEKAAPSALDGDTLKLTSPSLDHSSTLDTSALPSRSIVVNTQSDDESVVLTTTGGSRIAKQFRSTVSSLASTPRFLSPTSQRLRNFDYVDPGTPALPLPPPLLLSAPSALNLHATSTTTKPADTHDGQVAAWKVYVALILAQLCWSGFHVLGKYTFTFLSPFVLPTFRSLGTIPLFAVYAYRKDPNYWYVMSPRHHALMLLEALLGNTIAQQFFNLGTQLSSAALAGMLQPCIPVFTSVLAIALKREGVSPLKIVGICVAVLGSAIMVVGSTGETSAESPHTALGAICFIIQCFTTSVYIIIQKVSPLSLSTRRTHLTHSPHTSIGIDSATHTSGCALLCVVCTVLQPMFAEGVATHTFTFYLFLYGGMGHVIVGAFFLPSVDWANLPIQLFPIILYVVIVASFLAFSLFVFATNHLPASISSLGITCQSVFSPTLGALFLGETVSWENVVGGVAIAAGIVIVVVAKGREGTAAQGGASGVEGGKDVDGWHEARAVELSRQETVTGGDAKDEPNGSDDETEDVSLNADGSDSDDDAEGGEWDEDGYVERGGRVLSEEHANFDRL